MVTEHGLQGEVLADATAGVGYCTSVPKGEAALQRALQPIDSHVIPPPLALFPLTGGLHPLSRHRISLFVAPRCNFNSNPCYESHILIEVQAFRVFSDLRRIVLARAIAATQAY